MRLCVVVERGRGGGVCGHGGILAGRGRPLPIGAGRAGPPTRRTPHPPSCTSRASAPPPPRPPGPSICPTGRTPGVSQHRPCHGAARSRPEAGPKVGGRFRSLFGSPRWGGIYSLGRRTISGNIGGIFYSFALLGDIDMSLLFSEKRGRGVRYI